MTLKSQKRQEPSALQLHDRMTRGEMLTAEEQAALTAWYAQQDDAESTLLAAAPVASLATLQAQVDTALARMQSVTQRIQTLAEENEALRRENAALVRRLAPPKTRTA